jgi:hypothetical protein
MIFLPQENVASRERSVAGRMTVVTVPASHARAVRPFVAATIACTSTKNGRWLRSNVRKSRVAIFWRHIVQIGGACEHCLGDEY